MKTKRIKKFSTVVLSLLMAVSMMPSMAFAESLPDGADSDGIIYPTVNFTDVAPFLDPVEGVSPRTYARTMARTMSITPQADDSTTDKGMEISKTATANGDGTYTIKLEAYATGSKVISEVTKDVPTDIVLVLDQSGSMADDIGTVSFSAYSNSNSTNSQHYARRHNGGSGNLYYPLGDGKYAPVYVEANETGTYTELNSLKNYTSSWAYWEEIVTSDSYYYYKDSLYEKVGDEYKKVTVSRKGDRWNGYTYTYLFADGTTVISSGNDTSPDLGSHAPLYSYSVDSTKTVYTYTYTDESGNTHTIGTSTGANTTFGTTLYERNVSPSGGGSRLKALKTAVTNFSNSVATKAAGEDGRLGTDDDIQHRIAVVGFASKSGYGNNTELLSITGSNSGDVGVAYNDITSKNLIDVMQPMYSQAGQTMVTNAISALAAEGATETDLGVDMAKRILDANPVADGKKRNRVVIVFTDGSPTNSNGFQLDVANRAISKANEIKAGGTTVYSVGIFSGADATSAGSKPNGDLGANNNQLTSASNWFMQNLSSNNGTVQTPSYYLSAADSDALKNIFKKISDQIESGGSSTTLSSETVIKDIISPQFTLPAGTTANDITLETYSCTGVDDSGEYTWENNSDTMEAVAVVGTDTDAGTVSVKGFDFAKNYVGTVNDNGYTTYRGDKLVISFTVKPKDGFLGGNNVYTNTSAGVYEDSTATNPVLTFERPQVNVPIKDVTVTAADKNVYLLGSLTAEQLKSGTTVTVGGVSLNLNPTAENFGLETWQTQYVDITVDITDKNGNAITDLRNLTNDQTYTVTVKIAPKTKLEDESGDVAVEKTGSNSANINVFKPVVSFKDSDVYYGADAPASYDGNYVNTVWKHGESDTSNTSIIGTAPTLIFSYSAGTGIEAGKVNTKNDIPVNVTTKIGSVPVTAHTTFNHQGCTTDESAPTDGEFWLHVKTCELTITKEGGVAGEPYVFNIEKDGKPYTTLTIVYDENKEKNRRIIKELPVGTYTVTEDTNWSWRYETPTIAGSGVLTSTNPNGVFNITNTDPESGWLNDFSTVFENVFGVSRSSGQQ